MHRVITYMIHAEYTSMDEKRETGNSDTRGIDREVGLQSSAGLRVPVTVFSETDDKSAACGRQVQKELVVETAMSPSVVTSYSNNRRYAPIPNEGNHTITTTNQKNGNQDLIPITALLRTNGLKIVQNEIHVVLRPKRSSKVLENKCTVQSGNQMQSQAPRLNWNNTEHVTNTLSPFISGQDHPVIAVGVQGCQGSRNEMPKDIVVSPKGQKVEFINNNGPRVIRPLGPGNPMTHLIRAPTTQNVYTPVSMLTPQQYSPTFVPVRPTQWLYIRHSLDKRQLLVPQQNVGLPPVNFMFPVENTGSDNNCKVIGPGNDFVKVRLQENRNGAQWLLIPKGCGPTGQNDAPLPRKVPESRHTLPQQTGQTSDRSYFERGHVIRNTSQGEVTNTHETVDAHIESTGAKESRTERSRNRDVDPVVRKEYLCSLSDERITKPNIPQNKTGSSKTNGEKHLTLCHLNYRNQETFSSSLTDISPGLQIPAFPQKSTSCSSENEGKLTKALYSSKAVSSAAAVKFGMPAPTTGTSTLTYKSVPTQCISTLTSTGNGYMRAVREPVPGLSPLTISNSAQIDTATGSPDSAKPMPATAADGAPSKSNTPMMGLTGSLDEFEHPSQHYTAESPTPPSNNNCLSSASEENSFNSSENTATSPQHSEGVGDVKNNARVPAGKSVSLKDYKGPVDMYIYLPMSAFRKGSVTHLSVRM